MPSGSRHGQLDLERFRTLVADARRARAGDAEAAAAILREALALFRGAPLADVPLQGASTFERRAPRGPAARRCSRSGSSSTSSAARTRRSATSCARSRPSTRTASACTGSTCSRCTARAGRPTRSRRTGGSTGRSSTTSGSSPAASSSALEAAILAHDPALDLDSATAAPRAAPAAEPAQRRRRGRGRAGAADAAARPRAASSRPRRPAPQPGRAPRHADRAGRDRQDAARARARTPAGAEFADGAAVVPLAAVGDPGRRPRRRSPTRWGRRRADGSVFDGLPARSRTARCCSWSTTSSRCWARRPTSAACSRQRRRHAGGHQPGRRCASPASTSWRCRRWPRTRPWSCSRTAPARAIRGTAPAGRTRAGRTDLPPARRAPARDRARRGAREGPAAGGDPRAARAPARPARRRGSARRARAPARRCAPRSTGATTCSTTSARELFAQLGVFVGGWTIEAAEAVCGPAALDGIAALADQSLVVRDGARFAMLETLREYALERLAERADGAEVGHRHAVAYLALAAEAETGTHRRGPARVARAARRRAREPARRRRATRSRPATPTPRSCCAARCGATGSRAGLLGTGRRLLAAALDGGRGGPHARLQALIAAGILAGEEGDRAAARVRFSRRSGSPRRSATHAAADARRGQPRDARALRGRLRGGDPSLRGGARDRAGGRRRPGPPA